MAEQKKDDELPRPETLDEAFKRHSEAAEAIKKEYDEAYERLIGNISASHLEPFAKLLLERDGTLMDTEVSIRSIQDKIRTLFLGNWDAAWKEHIGGSVTKLIMLKEHFKEFEGKDWMMHNKSVEERTLPLRMEFKRKRLNWLQKQVEFQNKKIEKLTEDTVKRRLLIQRTTEDALKLSERIQKSDFEAKKRAVHANFNELLNFPNCSKNTEKDPSD